MDAGELQPKRIEMEEEGPVQSELSALVGLVLLGTAVSFFLELPTYTRTFVVLGSSLSLTFSGPWFMAGLLVALVSTGMDLLIRSHPKMQEARLYYTSLFWPLPSLLVGSGIVILNASPSHLFWLAGLAVLGTLLWLVASWECRSLDLDASGRSVARLGLKSAAYLAAVVLYVSIYSTKARSLVSATSVLVVSALLALELLRGPVEQARRTWLYAGVVGLAMGEATWGLNYWGIQGVAGGILLLLIFYVLTELARQHLSGQFERRVLAELALVAAFGLAVISRQASWFW